MAKKSKNKKSFARTAAKSMEKKLIENAKKLKENPYLILPDYTDSHSEKYFGKIKKSLDKIHRFSDDTKKLEKLSNKSGLDGALAGTLLIANSEKAPYLAYAKLPAGNITYAQRGKADKEKLIAVQHFDDPLLRLLGIKGIVIKKRLHVYSWDKGFISTGLDAKPPKEFINFVMGKTGFSYKKGVAICGDLAENAVKKKQILKKYYLRIHWKSADTIIAVSIDCAKSTKNTIFDITKYLVEKDISNDFLVDVIGHVIKQGESEQETLYINGYLSGGLTDFEFIEKNMEDREESLKQLKEKILILDGVSYGANIHKFIEALKPNKFEKKGLEFILQKVEEPVVLNKATPNKVLELFWKEYGLDAINSIINDEEMAEKFFSLDDMPSDILEVVFDYEERQQILSQLPGYKTLPPLANFADHIARTYKTFGRKKALAEIEKRPDTPKGKSLAYAFLLVFEKGKDKKWKYSNVEIEYGEFLKEYAKKLLDSQPTTYHKTLKELLIASGSSEGIDDKLIQKQR